MTPKLWGYVGVGVGILVLAGFMLYQANALMKKGVELGKAEARIEKLNAEVAAATAWKDEHLKKDLARDAEIRSWQATANEFEGRYNEILVRQPTIVYQDVIREVPTLIPSGDCDAAAVAAWEVLREAAGREGVPP